jgi:hypothetical protein
VAESVIPNKYRQHGTICSAVKTTWWWMVRWLYEVWKRVTVVQSEVLPQHMPGASRKSMRNLSQVSQAVGQDLNSRPPKYEVGVLSTQLWHSFLVLHIHLTTEFQPTNKSLCIKCIGTGNCESKNYKKHGSGKKNPVPASIKILSNLQPVTLLTELSQLHIPNTQLKLTSFDKVYYMLTT